MLFSEYFLNNKEIWFNHNYHDKYISERFSNFIFTQNIFNNMTLQTSNKELLDFIITFDQLPYYLFRDNQNEINKYHKLSLYVAEQIIDTKRFNEYKSIEKCFILLPLRHSNNIIKNKRAFEIIKQLRSDNNNSYYKRFYKASLEKICLLNNNLDLMYYDENINKLILDNNCTFEKLKYISFSENLFDTKYENICISLSGGVDSILLLYYLHYLKKKIYAIHINYSNRNTSSDEMKLCIKICNYLNIPIYTRTINEIKRDRSNDRDIYEEITKKIRFDIYKLICTKHKCVIALGHNKDDCIENIFSNIAKQQKMDNLKGMKAESIENDIIIIRPMLNIYKNQIYELAHKYELPYIYDSTPSWSERGMKRDKLIPFIKQFDPRIINGLLLLSDELESYKKISHNYIQSQVIFYNDKIYIKQLKYDFVIFKEIIIFICKTRNIPYFSHKSIINLYNKINKNQIKNQICLSKNYYYCNNFIYKKN